MNGRSVGTASLLVLLISEPLGASRISEHDVKVTFAPDGSVLQTTRFRLVAEDDLVPWTPLRLVLRDHETLEVFSATAVEGRRPGRKLKGIQHRSTLSIAEGTQYSALTTHWFELPALAKTAIVSLTYSVRSTPFFSEGVIEIPLDDPCRSARIEIVDPPPGFRYRIAKGPAASVGEGESGIVVTRPSQCGGGVRHHRRAPLVLHFAWGAARTWHELGRIYYDLLQRTPTAEHEVVRQARALVAGALEDGGDRLERLLDFVQSEIRNVRVELREGWYLPDSPSTVLARGWGDCKDKALLLSRLLGAAGIEAYPALIDSRPGGHFDPSFPRLSAFDHLIVAVAERSGGDGGELRWVFLDPTLPPSEGRLDRLLPGERYALVLRDGDRSTLEIATLY